MNINKMNNGLKVEDNALKIVIILKQPSNQIWKGIILLTNLLRNLKTNIANMSRVLSKKDNLIQSTNKIKYMLTKSRRIGACELIKKLFDSNNEMN